MRILSVGNMYPPHHQGGYELIWQSSDEQLRSGGHDVRTLTTSHLEPGVGAVDAADVRRELEWYWHDHGWPRLGARRRLALERHNKRVLVRHLTEHRPDAIAWWSLGGMSMGLLEVARRHGVGGVGVICDEWLGYGPRVDQWIRLFNKRPWLRPLVGPWAGVPTEVDLPACATYLFLSEFLRRNAMELDIRFGEGEVIHRGPDREYFQPEPARAWEWRLAYVGRIDPRKGIEHAIEALTALPPEATLAIVGTGDERHLDELRSLAERLGVASRVNFTSASREELGTAYAAADVVIFPVTWEEPWGLVPLEAMCVGRPVVATGVGGSGEYLRDGENSLLYDVGGGGAAIAARVRELGADEGLRDRLVAGGTATVTAISADRFNEKVEATLGEVV